MKKRCLYALFLCFTLNGMSPAHAEPTSFLTTIKGYITSIKEYAAGIYKHITSTNMLIGGATFAASALIANYFYTSKGYHTFQQQNSEQHYEPSNIPVAITSELSVYEQIISHLEVATESICTASYQTISQDQTKATIATLKNLENFLQTNKSILGNFSDEQRDAIRQKLLKTVDFLRKTNVEYNYIIPYSFAFYEEKNKAFKSIFKDIFNCAQLLNVSLPIGKIVIQSLHRNSIIIAAWLLEQHQITNKDINTLLEPLETLIEKTYPSKIGMLHELIRHNLNDEAKKIISCGADLTLKTSVDHSEVGLKRESPFTPSQTPFLYAVACNNIEMVKLLLYLNQPTPEEMAAAKDNVTTKTRQNIRIDQTINDFLNNPETINTSLTQDEQQEFDKIKNQRKLGAKLYKGHLSFETTPYFKVDDNGKASTKIIEAYKDTIIQFNI